MASAVAVMPYDCAVKEKNRVSTVQATTQEGRTRGGGMECPCMWRRNKRRLPKRKLPVVRFDTFSSFPPIPRGKLEKKKKKVEFKTKQQQPERTMITCVFLRCSSESAMVNATDNEVDCNENEQNVRQRPHTNRKKHCFF